MISAAATASLTNPASASGSAAATASLTVGVSPSQSAAAYSAVRARCLTLLR